MLLDLLEGIYFSLFTQMGCYTPFTTNSRIMYVTLELISFNNANLIGLDLPTKHNCQILNHFLLFCIVYRIELCIVRYTNTYKIIK